MNNQSTFQSRRTRRVWLGIAATIIAVFGVSGAADAQCQGCRADLDGTTSVGFSDLQILLQAWGSTGPANLDDSGVIGFSDLQLLLQAWGACPVELDSDMDGTPDCADGCPVDSDKIAPGSCGCGVSDTADGDGDGVLDCLDRCPGQNDAADRDGDGVPDCLDGCPDDADKAAPGACGCGIIDGVGCTGDVVSDDFNGCGVHSALWTVIDPGGVATFEQTGAGTDDALLEITLPPGVDYDAWVPDNTAARIMQPAADVDMQIVAKFESLPAVEFQVQGFLIEQDADNFLRIEFNSSETNGLAVFTAAIVDDVPTIFTFDEILDGALPLYLRATRSCDDWTVEYGSNGVDWSLGSVFTHDMNVTAVGLHAGATGDDPPGFTALIDSFVNTAAPLDVEDGPIAPGAEDYTLDVSVAGANGSVSVTPDLAFYTCDLVTLEAVPAAGYSFVGWSGDVDSDDNPLTIEVASDLTIVANVLEDALAASVVRREVIPGTDWAIVTWETDQPTDSVVTYGETTELELGNVSDDALTSQHAIVLTGLTPDRTYLYRASGTTQQGVATTTIDLSFDTLPSGVQDFGAASDDFNRFNIDGGRWSLFDPDGTAVLFTSGVGTDAAALNIELVPGPGDVVLLQPASNTDFIATVRFDNVPANVNEGFGIQAQADSDTRVLFEYYSNGLVTIMFAGTSDGGDLDALLTTPIDLPAPLYMRMTRAGSDWEFLYSSDGRTWSLLGATSYNHNMVVEEIGIFAAHIGFMPSYTVVADFFEVTNDPLLAEDGEANVVNDTPPYIYHVQADARYDGTGIAIDIEWATDEPSRAFVDVGLTPSYELGQVSEAAFLTEHVVSAFTPQTGDVIYVRIRAGDALGNQATSMLTVPVRACGGL